MEKRNDFSVFELKETCGRGAAGNYNGNAVLYTPAAGGIYQIEVLVAADCGGDVRYYVWDEDEDQDIGYKRKGDLKAFGVCDEQWQIDLRNCAKSYLRSTAYARNAVVPGAFGYSEFPAKAWKCNIFVAHMICGAGLTLQKNTHWLSVYPPVANDWAGNNDILNWERMSAHFFIQPGYVVAHPASPGSGHCGVIDFDGDGIAAGEINVNRNYDRWLDGTSAYRRYEKDE